MTELLKEYPKALVHLRQQFQNKRLGIVFGAGISKDLSFPNWDELIKGIANNKEVSGKDIYENSLRWSNSTAITQLLFQHFKRSRLAQLESEFPSISYRERRVMSDWREVIHEVLYKNALVSRKSKVEAHPYLRDFIPLINKSELSINYNFDDTIEFMLAEKEWNPKKNKERQKPYQTVWNPHMQFREETAVIYHPNGYLPEDKNLQQSDELVFLEESFSDQLIESMSGNLSTLLHQFTKKTCLFVGLSLEDNTLKHLLRQSATISPGNYHYFIRYTSDNDNLTDDEKSAIFNSNFEVYNLITLFLNSQNISSLAKIVALSSSEFQNVAAISGVNVKYTYYLVGTVAAGKSTVLNHFGCLRTYEEWMEERPQALSRPFTKLTETEKQSVDDWVDSQFFQKNFKILSEKEGIQIVDRSPLDPITFSPDDESMKGRAIKILEAISPGNSNYQVVMGQVVLIKSTPEELKTRLLSKRKTDWSANSIDLLQNRSIKMYSSFKLRAIENINRPIADVVKEIARVIHVENYQPINLHQKLVELSGCE
jgi:hypothetical protein